MRLSVPVREQPPVNGPVSPLQWCRRAGEAAVVVPPRSGPPRRGGPSRRGGGSRGSARGFRTRRRRPRPSSGLIRRAARCRAVRKRRRPWPVPTSRRAARRRPTPPLRLSAPPSAWPWSCSVRCSVDGIGAAHDGSLRLADAGDGNPRGSSCCALFAVADLSSAPTSRTVPRWDPDPRDQPPTLPESRKSGLYAPRARCSRTKDHGCRMY
jgi:hypothetical protein